MRYLGLDVGTDRIGVALSDETGLIASPHSTLQVKSGLKRAIDQIEALVESEEVSAIIIGLPLSLDGGAQGASCGRSKKVGAALELRLGLAVYYWDERFSTAEAERVLIAADMGRKARRKVVDKVAAALILQGYLDARGPADG